MLHQQASASSKQQHQYNELQYETKCKSVWPMARVEYVGQFLTFCSAHKGSARARARARAWSTTRITVLLVQYNTIQLSTLQKNRTTSKLVELPLILYE